MRANGVLIHWRWFRAYGNVIGGARPPGRSGPIQWNVVIYIKWPWIGAFLRCWFRLILYICEQFVYMCTMHRIIRSLLGGGCQWNFRKMMYFNAWKRPCRSARIGWDPKISPIEMPVFQYLHAIVWNVSISVYSQYNRLQENNLSFFNRNHSLFNWKHSHFLLYCF